jgi:hypothetical protein
MHKGTTAIQNIQILKWCKEFGIDVYWNFLYGFPEEPPEEYDRMADLIPLLVHLQPPSWLWRMHLNRFSPYFEKPEAFGLTDIAPLLVYKLIFPMMDPEALANLAYYFTFKHPSQKNVGVYIQSLRDTVDEWRCSYVSSDLFFLDDGKALTVWDQRTIASPPLTVLRGLEKSLYLACDSATSLPRLYRLLGEESGGVALREQIQEVLQSLVDRSLMIREGNFYLSLAIPVGDYRPRPEAWERFQAFLKKREDASKMQALMARVKLGELPGDARVSMDELKGAIKTTWSKGF